jgi:hypothetical protein
MRFFNNKYTFLISLFFLLGIGILSAKEIFVSSANTTEGDGTLANPYKTIQQAANVAVSGDVITIRAGIYREEVKIMTNGVTYQSFSGEKVVLNGTEILNTWTAVPGGTVYKTIMDFNAPVNYEQYPSNQIFVDQKMIELVRWPKQTSNNLSMPTDAIAENADRLPTRTSYGVLTDLQFDEPDGRWVGASIYINLSNGSLDGQGWTGIVIATDRVKKTITYDFRAPVRLGNQPWTVRAGTEYYLFNPKKEAINATGGINAILGEGEWWKDNDTLYVRTPNSLAPSALPVGINVIEAKKREFAFSPNETNKSFYTIKNLDIFGAAITTDIKFRENYRVVREDAQGIVLDNLNIKYASHFKSQTDNWQQEFYGRTGVVVSGRNNVIKNCTIQYSAGPGLCLLGDGEKALNNTISEVNYSASNAGALCLGAICIDGEVGYNTIYNTPHMALNYGGWVNSNAKNKGIARIHHNKIYDFLLRSNDSGAIDDAGTFGNWARMDHNEIFKTFNTTRSEQDVYGIYLDYNEGSYLLDHNLIYGLRHGVLINKCKNIEIFNNTLLSNKLNEASIIDAVGGNGASITIKNNILSYRINQPNFRNLWMAIFTNNIINAFGATQNDIFENVSAKDYRLKATATTAIDKGVNDYLFNDPIVGTNVDLGAFEYGAPAWNAGKTDKLPPTIYPNSGEYLDNREVTILSDIPNAQIRYTLDGKEPSLTSPIYNTPINLTDTTIVKATVFVAGIAVTETSTANIWVTKLSEIPPITVNIDRPASGTTHIGRAFAYLSSPDKDVQIRYTLDGSEPTRTSELYNGIVLISQNSTLKAAAFGKWIQSPVKSANYIIVGPTVTFSPDGGGITGATNVTLTANAVSSKIYYTLDGTDPSQTSTLYTVPIVITSNTTIKAIAIINSKLGDIKTATYNVTNRLVNINPNGGSFVENVNVTLSSPTPGLDIYYTTNGDNPSTASSKYTAPIAITQNTLVKAFAIKDNLSGEVKQANFTITGPEVTITPNGGNFTDVTNASLTTLAGYTIYYTLDGSTPTVASTVYNSPIPINQFSTTIKAIAIKNNLSGAVKQAVFTIAKPTLTIDPAASKKFNKIVKITIKCSIANAAIYYTLDGSTPTANSTLYTLPISIDKAVNIKAIAIKEGLVSDVTSINYDVEINPNLTVVFPNPVTNGQLGIKFTTPVKGQVNQVTIYDALGRLVYKRSVIMLSDDIQEENFDLPQIKPGTYFVKIKTVSAHVSDLVNDELKIVVK